MGFLDNSAGGGAFPPSIVPMPKQQAVVDNYINFHDANFSTWTQQYLPELYEAEVERYGNRTLSAFLRMVGAEMPMTSDQVIWSEQNRLHIAYKHVTGAATKVELAITTGKVTLGSTLNNSIRVGNTVIITDNATGLKTLKCYVSASVGQVIDLKAYTADNFTSIAGSGTVGVNVFVYGSEFAKGTNSMAGQLKPEFQQYNNKPIILKDHFEIDGSDTAQIGWVETTDEAGQTGFSWYLKAAGETRLRFEDYLETSMIEAVKTTSTAALNAGSVSGITGTEGMFSAIETRGNVFEDLAALSDFDLLLKNLDKQGAIEENMLYVNRALALTLDDMLGTIGSPSGSGAVYQGGSSFGVFNNDADMALNLGFSAFRRGSYDFYKSDWKYLNDAAARGGFGDVSGVLIPAGTSTVYDQSLGKNMTRPFLHVRYRTSQTDDRRLKSWVTGSIGSASYTGKDTMEVHYLSERCLVVQGANNFVMLKATT